MTAVMLAKNAMLTELAESLITRLRWLFGRPVTWRVVDSAIAALMAILAARLVFGN